MAFQISRPSPSGRSDEGGEIVKVGRKQTELNAVRLVGAGYSAGQFQVVDDQLAPGDP